MNCPVCRKPLIVVERHKIELDWCPACHGLWFDEEEFRLLAEALGNTDTTEAAIPVPDFSVVPALNPSDHGGEAEYKCPRCRKTMDKIELGGSGGSEPPVLVDRCPKNHGLWLDQGETEQALAYFRKRRAENTGPAVAMAMAGQGTDAGIDWFGEAVIRFIGDALTDGS